MGGTVIRIAEDLEIYITERLTGKEPAEKDLSQLRLIGNTVCTPYFITLTADGELPHTAAKY